MDCFVGLLMKETMKKKQQNRAYKKTGGQPPVFVWCVLRMWSGLDTHISCLYIAGDHIADLGLYPQVSALIRIDINIIIQIQFQNSPLSGQIQAWNMRSIPVYTACAPLFICEGLLSAGCVIPRCRACDPCPWSACGRRCCPPATGCGLPGE